MTGEDYDKLLANQGYQCAICERDHRDYVENHPTHNYFVVDHDHKTGKVRGLLCSNCNSGLGKLGDTRESILKALRYLEKHEKAFIS